MKNITALFADIYVPEKALVIYRSLKEGTAQVYVEAYDMDDNGFPINAHPLDIGESTLLAKALDSTEELKRDFLTPKGLLPEKVLTINTSCNGYAMWYTPPQEVDLLFVEKLSIPSGRAKIPAMLWKATREQLFVYALKTTNKPTEKTPLYHAPFFNVHENGNVCMGTVAIEIGSKCFLGDFITQWEQYFFNSFFSHLMDSHTPVNCNIVQLWQQQVSGNRDFPNSVLKRNKKTVKDLIS
jgi:PRTRC genetic system protein B